MTNKIMTKALEALGADVRLLIDQNSNDIKRAMKEQAIIKADENPEAKFSFGLSITATIEPDYEDLTVKTALSWNIKTKKTTERTVSDAPELGL